MLDINEPLASKALKNKTCIILYYVQAHIYIDLFLHN